MLLPWCLSCRKKCKLLQNASLLKNKKMPKNKLPFFVTEKSKCFRGGTIAANNWSFILPQECIFKQKQVRSSWFVLYKLLSWYIFFFSFQLKKELEAFDPAFLKKLKTWSIIIKSPWREMCCMNVNCDNCLVNLEWTLIYLQKINPTQKI